MFYKNAGIIGFLNLQCTLVRGSNPLCSTKNPCTVNSVRDFSLLPRPRDFLNLYIVFCKSWGSWCRRHDIFTLYCRILYARLNENAFNRAFLFPIRVSSKSGYFRQQTTHTLQKSWKIDVLRAKRRANYIVLTIQHCVFVIFAIQSRHRNLQQHAKPSSLSIF